LLVTVLLTMLPSLQAFAASLPQLEKLPVGERWFGLFFNDERAGFSCVKIRKERSGYELHSDSGVKMSSFAFSRKATIRETYNVNPDLTLRSFAVDQIIDGKEMVLKGETSPAGVKTVEDSAGSRKERFLKAKGVVYPPMAMNLIPLLKGAEPGRVYGVSMLDPEAIKIKKVKITVIGPETVGGTKTIHLRNDLYPVDNDIWIDYEGNTIRESVRDGWIVTQFEGEKTVRKYIAMSAVAKKDFIIDYSRVRLGETLSGPSKVKRMVLELTDIPADTLIPQGQFQKAEKNGGGKMILTVDNSVPASTNTIINNKERMNYLEATDHIPSGNPALLAKKTEIVGNEKDPEKIIKKLVTWVAAHIKDNAAASGSAPDAIRKGEGDDLAHARLYASLARAAGIPTRIALGLVYIQDKGFLYHCWAESYSGRWLPVDPTSGEAPVDSTHVKLVEGDRAEDFVALSGFVGKIKAKMLEHK